MSTISLDKSITQIPLKDVAMPEQDIFKWVDPFYSTTWNNKAVTITKHVKSEEAVIHEANILASCQHPNIIAFYGVLITDKKATALVLEKFAPDKKDSLSQFIHDSKKSLAFSDQLSIGQQILKGLEYLHEKQIIHTNLNPQIIVLIQGVAKITDFHFAKFKDVTSSFSSQTRLDRYRGPEWFQEQECEIRFSDDIYSFGMILWELFTRRYPYEGIRSEIIAFKKTNYINEKIPSDCPLKLKAIIESCWNKVPEERPTATDLLEKITKIVSELDSKT